MPPVPRASEAPCLPVSSPSPAASTPTSRTAGSSQERVEHADGVAARAHAGDQAVGQPPFLGQDLLAGLAADDRLEVAHHGGIGSRADHRADDVVGGLHVGHPVADGLVGGVLERAAAGGDRQDLRAQQPHAEHVQLLAADVLLPHVDVALQAEERGHGGRGHAVLPGAGLGDDALLAHAHGQQDLAQGVVDLVGAGVGQVLPLEVRRGTRPARTAAAPGTAASAGRRSRSAASCSSAKEDRVVAVRLVGLSRVPRERRRGSRARSARRRGRSVVAVSPCLVLPVVVRASPGSLVRRCGPLAPAPARRPSHRRWRRAAP